jgi:hypothetical protein
MSTPYLRQSDARWGSLCLPAGATLGRAGCTFTALHNAARTLRTSTQTPDLTLPLAIHADCFVNATGTGPGNLLLAGKAAPLLGLEAGPHLRERDVGERLMRDELDRAMAQGCALLWVDHDSASPHGDEDGDHYVSTVCLDGAIVCADPATGTECRILLGPLEGPAPWGKKTYRVRGVRALRPLRGNMPHGG